MDGWFEGAVAGWGTGAAGAAGVFMFVDGAGVEGPPAFAAGAAFGYTLSVNGSVDSEEAYRPLRPCTQ